MSEMPERPKTDADQTRVWARRDPARAQVYATLALANAIHAAAMELSGALIEAARIRARGTGR